jgi:hypothetical protein
MGVMGVTRRRLLERLITRSRLWTNRGPGMAVWICEGASEVFGLLSLVW